MIMWALPAIPKDSNQLSDVAKDINVAGEQPPPEKRYPVRIRKQPDYYDSSKY